jgi:phosphoribosyl-ATP pyrophosphohydrolase/phosphoribosyl-AMP cyclohydrolase
MNFRIEDLKFDERGLIAAVLQDAHTREVLTLAYMNRESLERTIETGETWLWSRSRNELWHKGETSGNTQHVLEVILDCDQDALVVLVEPTGPACHTGERTCFHNALESEPQGPRLNTQRASVENLGAMMTQLYQLVETRERERPAGSYTTYLFNEGLDKILKKLGEESAETIIAAKNESRGPLISEASDLIYHLIVLLVQRGISLDEISDELAQRRNKQSTERRK